MKQVIILYSVLSFVCSWVSPQACHDYYMYKSTLNQQEMQQPNDYLRKHQPTQEELPKQEGILLIPFLSKSQILQQRTVNLNTIDVDQEYYQRGETDYDYIVPLCLSNQTFLLKVDLSVSLIYLAGQELFNQSYIKYYPLNSLTHELLYSHNGKCLDSQGVSGNNKQASGSSGSTYRHKQTGSSKCTFDYWDQQLNYSINGDFILDEISFSYSENSKLQTQKLMLGVIRDQSQSIIYKNINGFFGIGSQSTDHSYSESLIYKIVENYNLNGYVYSMCLNHYQESGGFLILGGVDTSLYEGNINWISFTKVEQLRSIASSITISGETVAKRVNIVFETKVPNITVSENILSLIQHNAISLLCSQASFNSIQGLCSIDESTSIFRGNSVHIPKDLEKQMEKIPSIMLSFNKDGVEVEISNYFQRCVLSNPQIQSTEEWCSLIQAFPSTSTEDDFIVLGSQFLRNYYVIVDNQLARIGLAQKKSLYCDPQAAETLITLNDNNNARLAVNIVILCVVLFVAIKVTGGCLQFFDFGQSSHHGGTSSRVNEQHNEGQGNGVNNNDNGVGHESLDEDSTSQVEESTVNNSGNVPNNFQNLASLNSKLGQTSSSGAVEAGERFQTQTFRIEDKNEFQ